MKFWCENFEILRSKFRNFESRVVQFLKSSPTNIYGVIKIDPTDLARVNSFWNLTPAIFESYNYDFLMFELIVLELRDTLNDCFTLNDNGVNGFQFQIEPFLSGIDDFPQCPEICNLSKIWFWPNANPGQDTSSPCSTLERKDWAPNVIRFTSISNESPVLKITKPIFKFRNSILSLFYKRNYFLYS